MVANESHQFNFNENAINLLMRHTHFEGLNSRRLRVIGPTVDDTIASLAQLLGHVCRKENRTGIRNRFSVPNSAQGPNWALCDY